MAAETGNFREAAEKLFISQPSITVHIQQLEESLQVKLFKREHTKISLTEEGEFFLNQAKEILQKVEESKRTTQLFSKQKKTEITVVLSPLLTETNLPLLIYQFLIEHPEYDIRMIVEESELIDEQLLSNNAHIGIGIGKSKYSSIHAEKIISSPMQLVCPPDNEDDETGSYYELENLFSKYPVFTGHLKEAIIIEPLLQKYINTVRFMSISQRYIVKQFVRDGLGMAFLPKSIVYKEMMEGRLNIIDFDLFELPTVDLYMKYYKENDQILPLLEKIRYSHFY